MSDKVISIIGVNKSFRRFNHPGWRAIAALGFPVSRTRFDDFSALSGVNIEIGRGERVALIGRNGAGKSTLLRLIAGQMQADSGTIKVAGNVHALMELGTGFHPDFTGYENIRAALAYQGISPNNVKSSVDEIADFTELEDFLNRPIREYSSGMYARLAFAVATTIAPEVLIIDEILGAGDAYFMGKCIQRMKSITNNGATILFVSHDIGSAQMLCERGIWLDHGRVQQDGNLLAVSKMYLASVRDDEERRVRAKSMSLTRSQVVAMTSSKRDITLLRLIGSDGAAPVDALAVSEIRYGDSRGLIGRISPGAENVDGSHLLIDEEFQNWRGASLVEGRSSWEFGDYGGRFLHAPWQVHWPTDNEHQRWIELDVLPSQCTKVAVEQFDAKSDRYRLLTEIDKGLQPRTWRTIRVPLNESSDCKESVAALVAALVLLNPEDRYGSGEATITGFGFFDQQRIQRHTLISGEPASAVLACTSAGGVVNAVPVIAVYRPDGTCAMQVIATLNGVIFNHLQGDRCIRVSFDPLHLGPGDYLVSVALFRELNLASAVEPAAYDLHDRCYALKVLPPAGVSVQIGIVNQPASWELI